MASNVKVTLNGGTLTIVCDLTHVTRRTSKDTGDVLCAIDFEKLGAIVGATGVTAEVQVSLGVYLMDKAREKAVQASTGKPTQKSLDDMDASELRAWIAAQATAPIAHAPSNQRKVEKQLDALEHASKTGVPVHAPKPPTQAQLDARAKFAERSRAGTLRPKSTLPELAQVTPILPAPAFIPAPVAPVVVTRRQGK